MIKQSIQYTGKAIDTRDKAKTFGESIYPYIPSINLVTAINLAQKLGRPLLVKGEPGCGKSKLAESVAIEMHGRNFQQFYFEWNIKSTSKAKDGLYLIDNLKRLADANFKKDAINLDIKLEKIKDGFYEDKGNYISLGVIGKAFNATYKTKNPPIVLIDEIDKADIDFPNDLLLELDRMEFRIPEIETEEDVVLKANMDNKPIIIITSNDEKALPAAFLRRCLFYYINFEEIDLMHIASIRFPHLTERGALLKNAIDSFRYWRDRIEKESSSIKNISTSELLDWLYLINDNKNLQADQLTGSGREKPLYFEALLKDVETLRLFTA